MEFILKIVILFRRTGWKWRESREESHLPRFRIDVSEFDQMSKIFYVSYKQQSAYFVIHKHTCMLGRCHYIDAQRARHQRGVTGRICILQLDIRMNNQMFVFQCICSRRIAESSSVVMLGNVSWVVSCLGLRRDSFPVQQLAPAVVIHCRQFRLCQVELGGTNQLPLLSVENKWNRTLWIFGLFVAVFTLYWTRTKPWLQIQRNMARRDLRAPWHPYESPWSVTSRTAWRKADSRFPSSCPSVVRWRTSPPPLCRCCLSPTVTLNYTTSPTAKACCWWTSAAAGLKWLTWTPWSTQYVFTKGWPVVVQQKKIVGDLESVLSFQIKTRLLLKI